MAISIPWTYPVRGVQAVLSIVVLGLMAYGTSLPPFLPFLPIAS
jgi:hypothetical protein